MFVLDTNHLREFMSGTAAGTLLRERMKVADADVVIVVVSAEESLRGWLAKIASAKSDEQQVTAYLRLDRLLTTLGDFHRLPWDMEAAERFHTFRKQGVRIGSMDLKIACITIEHDAVLLTRNAKDFMQVPGLRYENWLD